MKVSVIVPNYNHAPFLNERMDSILSQTCQDIEVIVLDDCSTDNSRKVLEKYRQHPKVSRIVLNEKNSGSPFIQWQRGFELAQGEYVWIAESDDVAEPTFLEESLKRLELDTRIKMTFARSIFIDAESRPMNGSPDRPSQYKGNGIYDGRAFAKQRMLYRNVIYNASMVVFRKSTLQNISQEYATYRSGGDWIFWFDIMTQGDIAEIPLRLNRFRQHKAKVTVRAGKSGQNLEENARCLRHMCTHLSLTPLQKKCIRGRMTLHLRKKNFPDKQRLIRLYPDFYDGSIGDILLYEFNKWIGLTGMSK